jgi:crotonobetainyl-CoA:carnitine CoA-transferase CaiB-like acyl-CoA transferase
LNRGTTAAPEGEGELVVETAQDGLPLADIRVLDLTVARAGPTCVRQLADWGADVVRVEPPETHGRAVLTGPRHGPDFQNLHRNKRSLTLDLKRDEGRGVLLRLAEGADVLVENMRPSVKTRLGVDYEVLRRRNPRIIYGSISGFGQDGPYRDRGGLDQIAQGMGGLMSVTGLAGTEPTRVGIPVSDLAAGLYLAIGILVALHQRTRTGRGQWVRTSLLEAMIAMMDFQAARWTIAGEVPAQEGNHHPTAVPMGCFATSDGYLNMAASGGRLLQRFCDVIGLPWLPTDPRFDTESKRSQRRVEMNELIASQLRARTTSEWLDLLLQADVPAGPVYRMDEVFADPQVRFLEMVTDAETARLGRLALIRNAVRASEGGPSVRSGSPEAGEHTEAVLSEAGYAPEEIALLRRQNVI